MEFIVISKLDFLYLSLCFSHKTRVLLIMDLGANTKYKYSCSTLLFKLSNIKFAVYIFNVNLIDHPLIYTKNNYVYVSLIHREKLKLYSHIFIYLSYIVMTRCIESLRITTINSVLYRNYIVYFFK